MESRLEPGLVSVIVPAFNSAAWILETLQSIRSQSYARLEILVVDDGSQDATCELVSQFADGRIRLLRQSHEGAASARNRGLAEARGEFIQFLDSDDLLSERKIENQLNSLPSHSPLSIASCAWAHLKSETLASKPIHETVWSISDPIEWLVSSLQGGGMMQPACWLTRRTLIDDAGFWNASLTLHDDGEFFTRVLLKADTIVFVEDAVVYYRTVPGSLSRRRARKDIESAFSVCEARHRLLLQRRDDSLARRAISTQYAQFAYEFSRSAPDLAAKATAAIGAIGSEPEASVGGPAFRQLVKLLGFSSAMKLRSTMKRR